MNTTRTLIATATLLTLAACQTTPGPNPDLVAARSSLDQANGNPYVARSGAVELQSAQQAMARADTAWAADRDVEQTRHLAYLARKRADIALAIGMQAQSDERVQQFTAEREKVRLQARTNEADMATANARDAQTAARNAQTDSQISRDQADAARLLALKQSGRAEALERDLADLKAQKTDRGMVVTLGDVLFDTGKSTLQPGAQRSVEQLVQVLIRHPERRVLIEGFTDSVGREEMNMKLSQRRAQTFQRELMNGGIAADRIQVRAWGEANPVADNGSAAGRQRNRRVEVLFSDAEGRLAAR